MTADLYDASFGSDISVQDDEAARFLEGTIEGCDDLLTRRLPSLLGFCGEGLASDGEHGTIDKLSIEQPLRNHRDPARFVDVGSDITSEGLEIGQQRRPLAHGLEIVDSERDLGFAGERKKMKNGIRRSARASHAGNGV